MEGIWQSQSPSVRGFEFETETLDHLFQVKYDHPKSRPKLRLKQSSPECTKIAIFGIAIANVHRRPEIAAISGTL